MTYKPTIEIEQDEDGYHAIVIDAADDRVAHITNTYANPADAERSARDWLTRKDQQMGSSKSDKLIDRRIADNLDCPRYVALVGDSYVEADESLEALIAVVVKDGRGTDEDAVVWEDWKRVAAVILADGTVHRFDRSPARNGQTRR